MGIFQYSPMKFKQKFPNKANELGKKTSAETKTKTMLEDHKFQDQPSEDPLTIPENHKFQGQPSQEQAVYTCII